MGRRARPKKEGADAKRPRIRKALHDDSAKVRVLEARLAEALKQLQTRDRELVESLEQQTATAEILRVISSAHADAQPVFDTVVQSAARLCNATNAAVFLTD